MRFLTAGESHGKGLVGILEGIPAGLVLDFTDIDSRLELRRNLYGRSKRMSIESDCVEFISGIRAGVTTGAPISFFIKNEDYRPELSEQADVGTIVKLRPGHADFAGMTKYGFADARTVAERASGRETAVRTVIGAICAQILKNLSIDVFSHVINIGGVKSAFGYYNKSNDETIADITKKIRYASQHDTHCADTVAAKKMAAVIDKAGGDGDSVGGEAEIIASGMAVGYGSHVQYDRRLDAKIAAAMMSIPAVKSVSVGNKDVFCGTGSLASDAMRCGENGKIIRKNNYGGGIEGGISNGSDIVVSVVVKPTPTIKKGIETVDISNMSDDVSHYERADVCIVPAVSVVCESVLAITLAEIILTESGGDYMDEVRQRFFAKRERGKCL